MSPTFAECMKAALEVYRPEGAAIWMRAKNPMLGGESPAALIERGEGDRVLDLIDALASGAVF